MRRFAYVLSLLLLLGSQIFAQQTKQPTTTGVVPRLIRFSGVAEVAAGTTGITFSLHRGPRDSEVLWSETQNVKVDANGKFSVLLGATKLDGVPVDLFTSGEAQWLAVRVEGQAEQPRVLLVSVPYALKAAEAETLAGHAVSEFVTNEKLTAFQQTMQTVTGEAEKKKSVGPIRNAIAGSPTNFTGTTTDQIVGVTQSGTGAGVSSNATTGYALYGKSSGTAVYGLSTATSTTGFGVYGATTSTSGYGMFGANNATTGVAVGVRGTSLSNSGIAVYGTANTATGTATGVKGITQSPDGYGVFGQNTAATGNGIGVRALSASTGGIALLANETGSTGNTVGLQVSSASPSGTTALLQSTNTAGKLISGRSGAGNSEVFSLSGAGTATFTGVGAPAIIGDVGCFAPSAGVSFVAAPACTNYALLQQNTDLFLNRPLTGEIHFRQGNVEQMTLDAAGDLFAGGGKFVAYADGTVLFGGGQISNATLSANGIGAIPGGTFTAGYTPSTIGNYGLITAGGAADPGLLGGPGLLALPGNYGMSGQGLAGEFLGDVKIHGTVSAPAHSFTIDNPLDPAGKFLRHASVESSEMKNMYDGTVTTDEQGQAVVRLPEWFEALNGDFRYQLTVIGEFAQAIVAKKIANHQFTIRTDKPNVEVSWMVTGVRHDAYAVAHPLAVEEEKATNEKGYFLYPELFGAPREKNVEFVHSPELLKQMQKHENPSRDSTGGK
ncbi:hypothetical protein Acid345_0190 [Candidatus Koribacter versatilis Ellin345]|uniref:Peptidase S74 domain-containing protein n=1 Tax=Koribacter versatilis (strain Ellin345) TaxID=204669 RepID=Q1IVA5_KORVE|nr:hypothetical protein [Candidatus Koribacter versatilis]ABF39195.1 hypothetical protein Acid345_0190 [Candidatus Koribacter versatilis Ellin345]